MEEKDNKKKTEISGEDNAKADVQSEISLKNKLKETEDKLLRSLAEIENQRRRFEKEVKEALDFGGFSFAKDSLAVLDNFQRAKEHLKDDNELKDKKISDKLIKNLEVIENDLIKVFEKNKITKIECLNKKFDPNLHQAMMEIESYKNEAGIVIKEMQSGYMFSERLLRPALVGVSKKKPQKNEAK